MATPAGGVEFRGRVYDSVVGVIVALLPDFAERSVSTARCDGV